MAVNEQDWLPAHMCLDLVATFLSASPAAAMQALACPLLETLATVLHRFVADMQPAARAASTQSSSPGASAVRGPAGHTTTCAGQADEPLHFPPAGPLSIRTSTEPPQGRHRAATLDTVPIAAQQCQQHPALWHDTLLLKVVRMISSLAGSAPAHCDAFRELGVVAGLVGVLERFARDDPAAHNGLGATAPCAYDAGVDWHSSAGLDAIKELPHGREIQGEILIESLWCLGRLVDTSGEGQKAALAADGAATLSRCGHVDYLDPLCCSACDSCDSKDHARAPLQAAGKAARPQRLLCAATGRSIRCFGFHLDERSPAPACAHIARAVRCAQRARIRRGVGC